MEEGGGLGTRLGLPILYKDVSLVNCARRAHTCSIRIIIVIIAMSLSVCYFHPLEETSTVHNRKVTRPSSV